MQLEGIGGVIWSLRAAGKPARKQQHTHRNSPSSRQGCEFPFGNVPFPAAARCSGHFTDSSARYGHLDLSFLLLAAGCAQDFTSPISLQKVNML